MEARIQLLGRFAVRIDDVEVPPSAFGGRLARRLVRRLTVARGGSVGREALIDALWPDGAPADPDANLNVQVNRVRRATAEALINTVEGGYALTTDAWCSVDAEQFLDRVAAGNRLVTTDPRHALSCLEEGLALWVGEPLPEDTYAAWAQEWRAALVWAKVQALEVGSVAAVRAGDPVLGASFAREAVAMEPLREPAHVALMRALAAAGDRAGALEAYDQVRHALAEELGVDPAPATASAHLEILRMRPPREPLADTPRAASSEVWPFVGRSNELRRVRDQLGAGGIVLLIGASGSGKSRLLMKAVEGLDRPHAYARAFRPTAHIPFATLGAVLHELLSEDLAWGTSLPAATRAALASLVPEVADGNRSPIPVVDPQSRRALIREGSVRVLERAAANGVVVLLDDAQWADRSSLEVLALAAHRLDDLPLALALRPGEAADPVFAAHLADLRSGPRGIEEVNLEALPAQAIRQLIDDDDVVAAITGTSDCTPLAVRAVINTLVEQGLLDRTGPGRWHTRSKQAAASAALSAQHGQRATAYRRVTAQPERRRQLLLLLASLGREASPELLAAASGRGGAPLDTLRADLDQLREAGLVDAYERGWTLSHDDIGAAIQERLSPGERTTIHAHLAKALAHADPAELAHHLAAAGDTRAADHYATASRLRLDRFATDEAAHLADLGLRQTERTKTAELELLSVRAEAHYRKGDFPQAREGLRKALRLADEPGTRGALLARSAMLASGSDDMELAARLAEDAVITAAGDLPARARALAVASVIDSNTGHLDRAEERSREAERLFVEVADTAGIADVLDARVMASFLRGTVRTAIDEFDHVARLYAEAGNLLRTITPRSTRGHALLFAAAPEQALHNTASALRQARDLGHAEGSAYALWHHAEVLTALGRFGPAEASALEALRVAQRISHRGWTATAYRALGVVALAVDDLATAETAFRSSHEVSGKRLSLFSSWAASGLATVAIRRGATGAAADLVSNALKTGPPLAGYEARLAHAEVLVATGDSRAHSTISAALTLARAGGHELSGARLQELLGSC